MLSRYNRLSRVLLSGGLVVIMGPIACGKELQPEPGGMPVVAAPVLPVAGIVHALAPPGSVETVVLVPPGANPATYEPSIRDLRRAATSLVYLEIGHPAFVFERTWLSGLLEGSLAERVRLFEGCTILDEDPHAWLSTGCLESAAVATAAALARILPGHREQIARNFEAFRARLSDVGASATDRLAPYRGRTFFVLHPAWGYFARDYGLRQVEILSHGTGDPGASRLAELIESGRKEGIRAVFVQPQFNPAPAELVAEELGARVVSIDPLGSDPVAILEETVAALVGAFEMRN